MKIVDRIQKGIRLRNAKELQKVKEATARDPKKVSVSRLGQAIKGGSGSDFEDSPVDLEEIGRAYYTDSYIRRAVDKHSALMFKNGWELSGKNDSAVDYVWTRLKLMSEGTGESIESFFQEMADNLVLYGNAYAVKARAKKSAVPSGVSAVGYTGNQPISGYFNLPAQQVTIQRDDQGKVLGYQQSSGSGGQGEEFKPTEVVHLYYRKPSGRAYGIPLIFNVLDDVKILRQIEENVIRLIYRNLFPLYLYKVGLEKPGFEATDEEIEELREEIRNIPVDGALVVPERHNVEVVGSQGQAIDANGYLRYFRQRVFAGLGVSDTIMGISDSGNRSTSDNQSADLNDSVKDFQKTFSDIVKFHIINEILFEGGFDPILNTEDEVNFVFHEIEFDAKTKRENHIVQMFMQNAITFEEMRQLLGHDNEVDEERLFANMFGGSAVSTEGAANTGNNLDQPENQHGKKQDPGKANRSKEQSATKNAPISESIKLTENLQVVNLQESLEIDAFTKQMERYWQETMEDVQSHISNNEDMKTILSLTTNLSSTLIHDKVFPYVENTLVKGFKDGLNQLNNRTAKLKTSDLRIATSKHEKAFGRLFQDVSNSISTSYEKDSPIEHVKHVFTANKYRIRFTAKRIAYEAYNYGVGLAAEKTNQQKVFVQHHKNSCKQCMTAPGEIVLRDGWREELPPHHTNCECILLIKQREAIEN